MPLYTFSCFEVHATVCNKLDAIVRSFWCGHDLGTRKLHLVNWETICKPKRQGGLGFKKFSLFNQAQTPSFMDLEKYYWNQSPLLHQGRWIIGNGAQMPLSHPDWFQCSNQVLRERNLNNGTVADLIDSQTKSWKCDLVRKIYHPPIAKEILQIPLPKIQGNNDKLFWKRSSL